jgi:NADH:ubiquinone oxidoreductase subunit E
MTEGRNRRYITSEKSDGPFLERLRLLPRQRDQLLPALHEAEAAFGYLPNHAIAAVAAHLKLQLSDIDSVATGFPEFHRHQRPPHVLRVCTGPACACHGGDRLLATLADRTAGDPAIGVEPVSCLFACALAPVIELDGVARGRMSEERADSLVDALDGSNRT